VVNYRQDRGAAEEVTAKIARLGRKAVVVQADVSDLGQHPKLVDAALDAFGRIDILVNNAGIVRVDDVLEEAPDDFDTVLDTNLKAPHFLTQRVVNYMIAEGVRGCIIYTLSMNDRLASDNRPAYCISKAGLEMSMRLFAGRVAEHGIKVNGVQVGVTDTDLSRVRIPDYADAAQKGYISMVRPGVPRDIAHATVAAIKLYDTGAQIPASGGILAGLLNLRQMSELDSNRAKG
jgi:NAD(P)-dependent dehydrogenase (short-subunit alcohol dehydrogenase family)